MRRELPILFSDPMVLAIIEGRKTQTRRIVKSDTAAPVVEPYKRWEGVTFGACATDGTSSIIHCPYGGPGDLLWVREAWGYRGASWNNGRPNQHEVTIAYRADETRQKFIRLGKDWDVGLPKQKVPAITKQEDEEGYWDERERYDDALHRYWRSWRPSIFLPKWAARLWLENTGVKVERLHDISEADAVAEGVREVSPGYWEDYTPGSNLPCTSARESFRTLWHLINGAKSWDENPWLWVPSFKRTERQAVAA